MYIKLRLSTSLKNKNDDDNDVYKPLVQEFPANKIKNIGQWREPNKIALNRF